MRRGFNVIIIVICHFDRNIWRERSVSRLSALAGVYKHRLDNNGREPRQRVTSTFSKKKTSQSNQGVGWVRCQGQTATPNSAPRKRVAGVSGPASAKARRHITRVAKLSFCWFVTVQPTACHAQQCTAISLSRSGQSQPQRKPSLVVATVNVMPVSCSRFTSALPMPVAGVKMPPAAPGSFDLSNAMHRAASDTCIQHMVLRGAPTPTCCKALTYHLCSE